MLNRREISVALAAGLAAGAMLTGSGSAHAAASISCESRYDGAAVPGQTANWQIVESTTATETGTGLGASVVSGPSNLWVFPGCGEALHYHDGQWREAPFPASTSTPIYAAAASSPSDVWAFPFDNGSSTQPVLFWNGKAWARSGQLSGVTNYGIYAAAAAGPDSVWASDHKSLWHFNGQAWTRSSLPFSLATMSAAPGGSLWATGTAGNTPVVAHLSGGYWTVTPMTRFLGGPPAELCQLAMMDIYAQGADSVWAIGGQSCQDNGGGLAAVLHWNGSSWTAIRYHGNAGFGGSGSIAPDGSGGLWISMTGGVPGYGAMLHLTGGTIEQSALPKIDGVIPALELETPPGGGPVFGVGSYFTFPHDFQHAGAVIIEQRAA